MKLTEAGKKTADPIKNNDPFKKSCPPTPTVLPVKAVRHLSLTRDRKLLLPQVVKLEFKNITLTNIPFYRLKHLDKGYQSSALRSGWEKTIPCSINFMKSQ